ncbi:MAG: c-type cytochrome [Planctomycetia bacterium]|nr:c-type cytochrome [Planctomycetia bacterium]
MTRRFVCLIAFALLLGGLTPPARLSAQPKGGPLTPEQAFAALKVADGFQVELFAAEPMLINPTTIDVDHKGRVWVAEAVNYRRKNFGRPIIRKEGDRIVVLVDEKGEGKASKAVTFYQGAEIIAPLGVCVAPMANPDRKGGGESLKVFVCQSPDILLFEDKDGDLKADGPPKKFLTGFRGFDHDHGVHGINIGPDGKLYFTVGDAGVGGLQSSDGKGRKWTSNTTDCRAGTVWRCDMDGTNLELIAHNFRNNYECCVDSFGEVWLSDNDDDGNQQTRICFVMPGGNYGYHPRGAGQTHWHEEQPGIVHKTLRTGFGSPTGITFYEGALFDKKYTGALLHCDAGPREVRWFHRKPKGAGYELDKEILLTSTDNWFRPSDVCIAPDGSIFVSDWYDKGVGGHAMDDPKDGRIYRITPKGHKGYKVPEVKLGDAKGVLAALGSPCQAMRWLGYQSVQVMDRKQLDGVFAPVFEPELRELQARVFWAATAPLLKSTKKDPSEITAVGYAMMLRGEGNPERFLSTAFRMDRVLFGRSTLETPQFADWSGKKEEVEGLDAAARRELLLNCRDTEPAKMKGAFYALAKLYDGSDHFYLAALNIACGTDPKRRDEILADFDKHFPEWNDKVANLVWELRPKSVLPRLGKLLTDPKLTAVQKARIVDIIAANDDIAAGRTMLNVLKSDAAPEMKVRALESLKLFIPTKWKGLQNSKELAATIDALLKETKTTATALQLIAAAGSVNRIEDVVKIASDEKAPMDLRKEAVRTLGKLPDDKSVEALINIGSPKNVLSVDCVNALGELLPKGAKPPAYAQHALQALQLAIKLQTATPEIKSAALSALAANRIGTIWLLDTHQKGELPKELVAEAGRLLRNSPFQGERNRALLLFPAPGKLNPKNLPAIPELAKRTGDAARGKAVWNASLTGAAQCAKCHMVRGVGGQIGPDLSMIGKKGGRENLYESILIPSKAIADQYLQHQVTTTSDVTITGLLVAETPTSITLRDANGKDFVIPKKEIEGQVRKLKTSIMPEDIIAALNEDELADLVAYLETLKVAALTPDSFEIAGPFKAKSMGEALDTKSIPEPGGKFEKATWKTIRPDGKGYFDLAGMHGNAATNSASYMYVEIESPVDQDAEILLGCDDGAKLWVNKKEVFTTRDTKAAAPEQHKVAVKLVKGKNAIMLKVANGNNPHGFYFSLTSAEETKVMGKK